MNQEQNEAVRNAYEQIALVMKVGKAAKKMTNEVVKSQIQNLVMAEIEANHKFINKVVGEAGGFTSNFSEGE